MPTLAQAADYIAAHDPILEAVIKSSSLPHFQKHENYYEELVDSIISQQLSVKAAASIEKRFKDLFGGDFPEPSEIIGKDIEELRSAGLSRPKARYIHDLAGHILDGSITFDRFDDMTNEEITAELIKVKGIGVWTTHMFLMFCMARLDVLPIGDLGIRNGIAKLYSFDHAPIPEEIESVALKNAWHPYESVACWYIWQSFDNTPEIMA